MASAEPVLKSGEGTHLPELRLVLLGSHGAGKTSAGLTILGKEPQKPSLTAQCVRTQEKVSGRQVVLVDTPGWNPLLPLLDTSHLYRWEIEGSASLCPPGPHCLLLVVPLKDEFTCDQETAVQEHLELLGETVWNHIMVLFTHGGCLRNTPIKEFIEHRGKALQRLVEKCGNRYHVLDNRKIGDHTQVTQLLDKIDQMVKENRGGHYELCVERWNTLEDERKTAKARGEERRIEVQRRREDIRPQMVKSPHLPNLRILVMGYQYSGKSSTVNTILGRKQSKLPRTVRFTRDKDASVAGRLVTVVDTPGRWRIRPLRYTSELFKQEIMLGPSQCAPGPHAVLLVLPANTVFTKTDMIALQEHLELLGDRFWRHTILLFTYGDWLGNASVEQFIESEGLALQQLVDQCGNRYHVFNNEQSGNDRQVAELLEKLEELVHVNGGSHFEVDRRILDEVEEKRRTCWKNAEERKVKVQIRRERFQSIREHIHSHPELQLVLLGYRRAGQTLSANTILGTEEFDNRSCLTHCVKRQATVSDRLVSVVCTPGWGKTQRCCDTPAQNQEIVGSVGRCSPGPHAILLVLRASMSFCPDTWQAVEEHLNLLGKGVWSHTMLLFTYGDRLGDATIEQHIESEGEALKELVERCGNRYHVLDNYNRNGGLQVKELLEKIEEMVTANGGCYFQVERDRLEEDKRRWGREEVRGEGKGGEGWREEEQMEEQIVFIERSRSQTTVESGYDSIDGSAMGGKSSLKDSEESLDRLVNM